MTPPQPTLYPHESIVAPIVVFVTGLIILSHKFVEGILYPPQISQPSSWCYSQTTMTSSFEIDWLVILGIILMVVALVMFLLKGLNDTPIDIEKEIKQHEDAIVKLRSGKK